MRSLDSPLSFFFKYNFETMLIIIMCFFVYMLMFIFPFTLVKQLLMFQLQYLFVIKLGMILISINMLIVCKIHTQFFCVTLKFILHAHFLQKKGGLNELF